MSVVSFSGEVRSVAQRCGVPVDQLPKDEAARLRKEVANRYAHGRTSWMWESFDECVVLVDDAAWAIVGQTIGSRAAVLFFDEDEDTAMFRFGSGEDLARVLGECFRFEYNVTDQHATYLIAVNHHDVIHALGSAEPWLQAVKGRLDARRAR